MAKRIMIQGTMSDAGKSIIATGLCRIFYEDGFRAAPFKSQNMALNSFATATGGEIGRAQALQAQAAGAEADVRMNPILLKPTDDRGSQVVVNGKPIGLMSAGEYFKKRRGLMPEIERAYHSLDREYDIIVIEGAGSPAELNLKKDDIVNMGIAKAFNAPVLLCADIDRGGVFAQCYGTLSLLEEDEREHIEGLIVNKFRGDISLFSDGVRILEDKCKKNVLGVVPFIEQLGLEGEDSLSLEGLVKMAGSYHNKANKNAVIIRLPHISNYTDFASSIYERKWNVSFIEKTSDIKNADIIIIPGTKNTIGDLMWLRDKGFDKAIKESAKRGVIILGICGGYQMLGEKISDPYGVEGKVGSVKALGLLPVATEFKKEKCIRQVKAHINNEPFSGDKAYTYEIHMGKSVITKEGMKSFARLSDGSDDGCVYGNVYGTYLHGIFDNADIRERELLRLSSTLREALDIDEIYRIMERYI